jgi:hypothetical protein
MTTKLGSRSVRRPADPDDDDLEVDWDEVDDELPDEEAGRPHHIERAGMGDPLPMLPDAQYFAPGRDAGGATERLFIRLAPRYRDWIASYANDARFPFKGMNHLVRWCVDQGLRKLDRIRPTPTLSTQIAALQNLLYEEQIAADFALVMQQTEGRIDAYVRDGAKGEACRLIQTLGAQIREMPDGYWKGKYKRAIRERWGELVRCAGVDLDFAHVPADEGEVPDFDFEDGGGE